MFAVTRQYLVKKLIIPILSFAFVPLAFKEPLYELLFRLILDQFSNIKATRVFSLKPYSVASFCLVHNTKHHKTELDPF